MNKTQFGVAEETVYGTPVTVTRFYEILGGESLGRQQNVIQAEGLRPGLRTRAGSRRKLVREWGDGQFQTEVATKGFGLLFKHMLGTAAVTATTTGSTTHLFTPGSLKGRSLTMQKGVEKTDETAQAFTMHGVKITEWELSVGVDGFLMLSLTVDGEAVETTTALATASYPAVVENLTFATGVLLVDDVTTAGVSDATIAGANALNTERWFLGSNTLKSEPLENGYRELSGSFNAEFRDLTSFYAAFETDAKKTVKLKFTWPVIDTGVTAAVNITLYDVRFTGETPKASGPEPAVLAVGFEGYEDNSGNSIAIEYRTVDTTP